MNKLDHEKITQFAIENFEDLFTPEFKKLLREQGSLVCKGSKKEDEGFPVRILNWHFYRAEDSPYLKPFPVVIGMGTTHPSSRKRFIKHATALADKNTINSSDVKSIFLRAGRIIHHIQDMSTPAHVIPIYHGSTLYPIHFPSKKDAFETFSQGYISDYLEASKISMTSKDLERIMGESDQKMISLYDLVAKRTLEYLDSDKASFKAKSKVNGEEKTETPNLFWVKFDPENLNHNKTDGWGHYGPFGEATKFKILRSFFGKLFGKSTKSGVYFGAPLTIQYNGDDYAIAFKDYEHIYIHLIRQMVIDTLTVLLYVQKHILKLS